ncbi:MAG: two-component regulator propeller domain-containing protein [Acidobacteriota bacterium]|nr:ATP-binding protein [Blastocatellia bacterium]MDW8239071.1 two-component regulator propeller domain-containing protein [Acidobacteriota bacterium]
MGLSQNLITCILQDRQGFLWFGTKDGLNRFDGYKFTVYQHDPYEPTSLSDSAISALHEDQTGRMWVGTQNGLNLFDRSKEVFYRLLPDPNNPNSLSHPSVGAIAEDREGAIWIGTLGGGLNKLVLRPPAGGKASAASSGANPLEGARFTRFTHDPNNPNSLGSDFVGQVVEDGRGTVWATTMKGTLPPAQGGYLVTRFRGDGSHPAWNDWLERDEYRKFICRGRNGRVWIGVGSALIEWDAIAEKFTHHQIDFSAISGTSWKPEDNFWQAVRGMMEDRAGTIWIGSTWGLARFDPGMDTIAAFRYEPGNPHSIAESGIYSICEDSGGVLWFGSNGNGLFRYDPKAQRFTHRHREGAKLSLWRGTSIRSLCQTRDGTLWIGTANLQLLRMNRVTGEVTPFQVAQPNVPPLELVFSMLQDRTGALWIGSSEGLFQVDWRDGKPGQISRFKPDPDVPRGSGRDDVYKVIEDRSGEIWIATANALSRLDRAIGHFVSYLYDARDPDTIPGDPYTFIHQDRNGIFWLGAEDGLLRFDPPTAGFKRYRNNPNNPSSLSHNVVRAIAEDPLEPDKILWVGTAGGGLNRFDKETETFTHFTEKDGLPNNVVYAILSDGEGNLWMSTNQGLARFNPRTRRFKNFDIKDGLQDNEFNSCASFKSASGELFFGGISGFNAFYPEDVRDNPHAPPVVITDFQIFNQSVSFKDPDSPLKKPITETGEITLSYEHKVFSFEFAALDFTEPSKNQYAYKMDGFDKDWQPAGTNRTATYTNLDPGEYVFRVKASNNDGVWNDEGVAINVTITPPWWRTGWAYMIYALLLIVGGAAVDRIQRRRVIKRERDRAQRREAELIRQQAAELETIDRIVKVINRTVDLESLFQALLEQGLKLVPHAERATVLIFDHQGKCFKFAATVGYDLEQLKDISFTPEEMVGRYTTESEEVEPGVYILQHVKDLAGEEKISAQPRAAAMLIMAVEWGGTLEGYLVFDNLTDLEAFDRSDARRLNRLREHAISAIAKANTLKTLEEKNREIVKTQAQLIVQEKLASLGQLTAGIAHEIKNPLNFINNFAALSVEMVDELREELDAHKDKKVADIAGEIEEILKTLHQNAAKITEHGQRADSIVYSMLQHSRGKSGQREMTDINHLLDEAVNLTYHGLRARDASFDITIEKTYDDSVGKIEVAPQDISRAFLNILNNACYAAQEKSKQMGDSFSPRLWVRTEHHGEEIEIRIRDNGNGIPPAIRDKIFNPFFTTKPAGQGTGLGLSISHELVVQVHQGEIMVETQEGEFTEFIIILPKNVNEDKGDQS